MERQQPAGNCRQAGGAPLSEQTLERAKVGSASARLPSFQRLYAIEHLFYAIIAGTGREIKGQSFTFVNRGEEAISRKYLADSWKLAAKG